MERIIFGHSQRPVLFVSQYDMQMSQSSDCCIAYKQRSGRFFHIYKDKQANI